MRYAVIIEGGGNSFSAYVPDLPGCVTAGESRDEARPLIREAIEFHIEDMEKKGEPIPEASGVEFSEVAA